MMSNEPPIAEMEDPMPSLSLTDGVLMVLAIFVSRFVHPRQYALARRKREMRRF